MYPNSLAYGLAFLAIAQLTGWLAVGVFRPVRHSSSEPLGALLLAITLRALAAAFEFLAPTLDGKLLAAKAELLGLVAVGPLWLTFALQFTGRGHLLTRRNLALLAMPSLAVAVLGLTNEMHSLVWAAAGLDPEGYPGLVASPGMASAVYALLNYAYLLSGALLFMVEFSRAAPAYRAQIGLMAAAALAPLAGNAVTLAGLVPELNLDATQISLPIAGAVFAIGLYRFGRWDLAPVAARAVIDNLRDAVIVLDTAGRVIDLSAAARRLFALGDEALGRPAADVLRPAEVWRTYAGAAEAQTELELSAAEGEAGRSYQLIITPLRDRRERLLGRVALVRDVTDERALLKMRDDLTHMLIHDLRNPFSAIYSALQLIKVLVAEWAPPEGEAGDGRPMPRAAAVEGAIDIALNSSKRAQEMLDSLLDLNQLEGGQMPVATEPLDAGLLARTVAEHLRPAAETRGLTLTVAAPEGLPETTADPDLLDRVLRNLLGNAIKFTPPGGRVTVAAHAIDGSLEMSVSDTGPGIAPEIQSSLFQKFTRGPGEAHGSGLGLAFCKLAVEAMGGHIWAENREGGGAALRFTLPLAQMEISK